MRATIAGVAVLAALGSLGGRAGGDEVRRAKEPNEQSDFVESEPRGIVKDWNRYDFGFLTFKWGIFTLLDFGTAAQSDASAAQVNVDTAYKVRDFRFSFSGRFGFERDITYTTGIMYDGASNSWFARETGIQIAFPELWGYLWIGRQKEGISLNKVMVGYAGWTMERMPMGDASIPILADGIKWLGVLPSHRANFNLSYYYNVLNHNPSLGFYRHTVVARVAVLPMLPDKEGALLHLGVAYHWGKYTDGEAQLRSRPESNTAPYFLDTDVFPADYNNLIGLEAYYVKGPLMIAGEYLLNFVHSPETGNPFFHGGEVSVVWNVTGESRAYKDIGGKLDFVRPAKSAFEKGSGGLETVLHFSYTDLDDGSVQGGKFWRLTPEINWHIDDMVTLRVNYGLGHLDRFDTGQFTHFFQGRLQIQIQ